MHPIFAAYWARLNELHEEILHTVDGVPAEALDWSPGADLNSIAVLATHVAGAERFWIGERVGGQPAHRDRDSEFRVRAQTRPTCARDWTAAAR